MGQGRAKFDLSQLNFLKRLGARGRLLVLVGLTVLAIVVIYFGTRYFFGSQSGGGSNVAAPSGIQSIQGSSNLSPAYQSSLEQANIQRQQQAALSGGSAVPTQINYGNNASCIICSEQSANVKNLLDNWVNQGAIMPDVADQLARLAAADVPVSQYAAALDQLVKEGKLTPEQARQLLAEYQKQHANAAQADSARLMDSLMKNGQLPLDEASQLLADQKNGISPADYARRLQDLVNQGKISSDTAQQLLSQYNQQKAKEAAKENAATIAAMAHNGEITPDVAKELTDLANKGVPVADYQAALARDVAAGKLTPQAAQKLLAAYSAQKGTGGPSDTLADLVKQTPKLQDEANKLNALQANNASSQDYANELKNAVLAGLLTPDQAAGLMDQYEALRTPAAPPVVAGNTAFGRLQQRVQTGNAATPPPGVTPTQFAAEEEKAEAQAASDRQARIEALTTAMSGQAQQLITAWEPPVQAYKQATPEVKKTCGTASTTACGSTTGSTTTTTGSLTTATAPLIKAGTILFAVLDTTVNSDYPDSPVMATVVQGPYKGAKLLGKLVTTKGVAGQMDRIMLNFTLMDMDAWTNSKTVTAYAIDPDTARTALASQVDYHYLLRFGAIMATSFAQGFGNAITNQGTSTTGIFGTSNTHPALGTAGNIYAGLGQIGQTLGTVTQNYVNVPPTVKVDSGVGLGILFMSDVTQ